jgi:hypothetical protein
MSMERYRIGKPWLPQDQDRKWEDVKPTLDPAEVEKLENSGAFTPPDEATSGAIPAQGE